MRIISTPGLPALILAAPFLFLGCGSPESASRSVNAPVPAETLGNSTLPPLSQSSTDIQNFLNADSAASLREVFRARYAVDARDVRLVVVRAGDLDRIAELDQRIDDEILVAFASGEFVDAGAHPPIGYDLPKGRLAYTVVRRGGQLVAGGLLIEDRSADLLGVAIGEVLTLDKA